MLCRFPETHINIIFLLDGVREKDKHSITLILKQVSAMKDNTYHLLRHIWNDVSEDWPFYTEEERQAFRRRKPQNLTPPGKHRP
jgi:RNA polymerase II elongation factor ELL